MVAYEALMLFGELSSTLIYLQVTTYNGGTEADVMKRNSTALELRMGEKTPSLHILLTTLVLPAVAGSTCVLRHLFIKRRAVQSRQLTLL